MFSGAGLFLALCLAIPGNLGKRDYMAYWTGKLVAAGHNPYNGVGRAGYGIVILRGSLR
jgi:hypothetical protein